MPLVRVDAPDSRSAEDLAAIGDGVHRALVEAIGIPKQDRFQVLSRHAAGGLVFDRHYLGISRSDGVVFVQITMSLGRSVEQKKAFYKRLVEDMNTQLNVRPQDVVINLVEVAKENWSYGGGIAQYVT